MVQLPCQFVFCNYKKMSNLAYEDFVESELSIDFGINLQFSTVFAGQFVANAWLLGGRR
jgi:hypothetical protein